MKSSKSIQEQDIPIVDLGVLQGESDLDEVGRSLVWAATEVGFIYVKNHGVSDAALTRAREAALAFFRLPDEQKLEAKTNAHHHGYLRPGSTKMHDDAEADLKESFNWGIELDERTLADERDNPLLGPNQWPTAMPELQAAVYPYFEQASDTATRLLRAFARGVSLPTDFFLRQAERPVSRGSLQYYPPQSDASKETRFGVAPHTDFGVLTVLCQDANGGLELQMMSGEWRAVPPIEGTFVVNVGDLLHRWSNGRFRSTPHRVINTSGRERLSLVLAYDPNFETSVESQTLCLPGESPQWQETTVGEYLMWRFAKAFAYRKS